MDGKTAAKRNAAQHSWYARHIFFIFLHFPPFLFFFIKKAKRSTERIYWKKKKNGAPAFAHAVQRSSSLYYTFSVSARSAVDSREYFFFRSPSVALSAAFARERETKREPLLTKKWEKRREKQIKISAVNEFVYRFSCTDLPYSKRTARNVRINQTLLSKQKKKNKMEISQPR